MLAHSPRSSIMSSSSTDDFSGRRPSSSSAGSVPMSAISRTRTLSSASAAAAAAAAAGVTAAGTPNNGVSPPKSSPLAVSEPRSLESQEPEPSSPLPSAPSNRASIMSGYQKFDSLTRGSMAWVSVPSGLQSPVSPAPPVRPPSDAKTNIRGGAPAPAVTGQVLGSLKDQIIPSPSTGVEFATTPPEQRA
ncbi:hypothetical protein BCR44DRAFT_1287660 [Catenaria anguillulae PL171]|uniref:Uncharacterized protein n=1 Tax=Catenaria anguillulae PL171 TaxID=765915 RepID=A0A1Y2HAG9_9FUNG|nr:hypothetical protein BCR44DRAFT_1287660 [Catenaria anguillulae PL171]